MKTSEFDFYLPEELIAQTPLAQRSDSRLLLVNRKTNELDDKMFRDLPDLLTSNDVLVLNNTKVLPAKLIGQKTQTKALIEILLINNIDGNYWEIMAKPARRFNVGDEIIFSDLLKARCIKVLEEGLRVVEFFYDGIFYEILDILGTMPLPPYIKEKLINQNRYQTVYASQIGSVAAPTAGLHFTEEILQKLQDKGVLIEYITLHVGLGTFKPVTANKISDHKMHSEKYYITKNTAKVLNKAKNDNKRIIAVGTTTIRTLESNANPLLTAGTFNTDIFIYPPYKLKFVDCLITNFHLPKSTLIMLVSAISSIDLIKKAYQHAVESKYRFFSFGDSMFLE